MDDRRFPATLDGDDGNSEPMANGQVAIWLMNGTTPTTEVPVGNNPGPTWHIHVAS